MIAVNLHGDNLSINFPGSPFFRELVGLCKHHKLRWSPEDKVWVCSPRKFQKVRMDFADIDDLDVPEFVEKEIERLSKAVSEVKRVRRVYKPSITKGSPLGPYQVDDIKKMISTNRVLNANEQGLGKSFETVATLNHLLDRGEIDRILIVGVSEVTYNWQRELLRFSGFFKPEDVVIADKNNRAPFDTDPRVVIMSYNTFKLVAAHYYKQANRGKKPPNSPRKPLIDLSDWGSSRAIILDESHSIKNPSVQTKYIHSIKDFFEFRYLLTGTPYPNSPTELYYQIKFLDKYAVEDTYQEFVQTIANVGNKFSAYAVNYCYPDKVERFIQSIDHLIIRRFKVDHLDLPDLNVKRIYVPMDPEQRALYQALITEQLNVIKEEHGRILPREVQNRFPYFSLACDNPAILKGKIDAARSPKLAEMVNGWKFEHHSKLPYLEAIIADSVAEGHQIVVWSGHPGTLDALGEQFKKYNPVVVHGQTKIPAGMSKEEFRDDLLTEFRTDESHKILFASFQVLGTGVNITEASRQIYFDRSYDLKYYLQSQARLHRNGQEKEVTTYLLLLDETLDLRLDAALSGKEELNNNLMNREKLSNAEWKQLFSGDLTI